MTWAQRLKRVFNIDIEVCTQCGGPVKVIASIEDPAVIKQFLEHLQNTVVMNESHRHPESWGSPQAALFDEGKDESISTGTLSQKQGKG